MKIKIGIFGSAVKEAPLAMEKAAELGRYLAKYPQLSILTGACTGVPYQVAYNAYQNGARDIWGFSSYLDEEKQRQAFPDDDFSIYGKMFYSPANFYELFFANSHKWDYEQHIRHKYRNVILTANSDIGIIVSGRWGTLNEFTNLADMGKMIGVLTGTGGAADQIQHLTGKINKQIDGAVIFDDLPEILLERLLNEYKKHQQK